MLLLACLGVVLILQGWKSRIPRFDLVVGIEATEDLIDHGAFPDKGILTSFGSYTPPGVTWLLLPGLAVSQDPRLFEYVGSVGLFVGTLFGMFFLARRYFGFPPALLAVALYSCSELGLLAGSTLFPTHTTRCFYVWMIYFVEGGSTKTIQLSSQGQCWCGPQECMCSWKWRRPSWRFPASGC